jgi:oligosaccharyltransferase complex subunit beta
LGNRPLLFPVLKASRTAYTYDTKEDEVFAEDAWTAGQQMYYLTALQARNDARLTISGSTDMFSDEFFGLEVEGPKGKKTKTANRAFAKEITEWTFKETGVVEVKAVRHHLANETDAPMNPGMYRVKNDVVCTPSVTSLHPMLITIDLRNRALRMVTRPL